MDINALRSVVTVLLLVAFLGIVYWAYSRRNRERFEDMAALPLMEESPAVSQGAKNE
ncbi:cbb3-type cytochrome oxidase subunit 3 [Roseateles sp. BYS180W]|uniref:Cbb3-type cytochrome oxidase subunit 3 n=1 Tax=Roseateles rivi TaxID=3299028 RepID=A0ABW7FYT3_9BURK